MITFTAIIILLYMGCARIGTGERDGIKVVAPHILKDILETAAGQFKMENQIPVSIIYSPVDSVMEKALSDSSADLIFSPMPRRFGKREYRSKLYEDYVACPFRLSLVVASRPNNEILEDLLKDGDLGQLRRDNIRRIVINDPDDSYEGVLALRVLDRFRLKDKLQPKLIIARDREHLLSFLETGEAEAGIILEKTLHGQEKLSAYLNLDRRMEEYLNICGAVTAHSRKKESALAFLDLFDSGLCEIYRIAGVYQR